MSDGVTLKGRWFITLYGPDGQEKAHQQGENVITEGGLSFLASFLIPPMLRLRPLPWDISVLGPTARRKRQVTQH